MTKRKAIPARVMVSVAIRQAWQSTAAGCEFFACGLCRQPLNAYEPRILEHMTPRATLVALGMDPDTPANLYWVHAECAAKKTNGTKATTAGSDKHMIRKGERVAVRQLPKSEIEIPVTKKRFRWKRKVGGGAVRVRTR